MEEAISIGSPIRQIDLQPDIDNGEKQHRDSRMEICEEQKNTSRRNNSHAGPITNEKTAHSFLRHLFFPTDASTSLIDPGLPPDGGTRAWLQVVAGHFVNTLTWGYVTSYGIFQTYYVQELDYSTSDISWIGSIQIFLLFGIGTFSGRATDAGLARQTIFLGSLLLILGTFITSLCTQYWQIFLAQGVCTGAGMGIVYMPALTLIGTYFSKRRVLAVGLAAAGASTGSLIFPAMIQYLIPVVGFPWAVRCMAFVALSFTLIFNVLLRARLPPRKSGPLVEWAAFKEPPYALFTIGMFLIFWALYFAYYYIDAFALFTLGFTQTDSTSLLLLTNGIGLASRLPLSYIADRHLGPINTLIPTALAVGLSLFGWAAVRDRGSMYAFAAVYGLVAAGTQSLFASAVASLTHDLGKIGTRMGMVFSALSVASLTGAPVAGAIIDKEEGGYVGAQVWAGTMVCVGCVALGAARVCETGWVVRRRM